MIGLKMEYSEKGTEGEGCKYLNITQQSWKDSNKSDTRVKKK